MAAALVLAVVITAVPAGAKEGVRARLDAPVNVNMPAGKTLRVKWRLVDEHGRPFGASGIYLRVSRCGRGPLEIAATRRSRGHYSARVRVPTGGVRKLMVGLRGWRITGQRRRRADAFFQFDPPLHRDCG
jgi:hypothetical protein